MCGYGLNIEFDYYGPYYSEEQARFAQYLFASRYPDLADFCSVATVDLDSDRIELIDPRLLH